MAEIWSKKKKILSRKERFRIPDEFGKKKNKDDSGENVLTQKEEEIQRQQLEERAKFEKAKEDHRIRHEKVKRNFDRFQRFKNEIMETEIEARKKNICRKYPEIKNLNRIIPWVNEKISEWQAMRQRQRRRNTTSAANSGNNLKNQINECVQILNTLTTYIENPLNLCHLDYWYECKRNLRDELYYKLDCLTYEVIKHVEKEMTYLDSDVMYYKECNEHFSILVWTVLDKPRTGKEDKFPLMCNFADVGVTANLPKTFLRKPIAVRCLWMVNDYFSEDCRTFEQNRLPTLYECNFLQYMERKWKKVEKLQAKKEEDINMQLEKEKKLQLLNKIKYLIPSSSKENVMDNLNVVANADKIGDESDKDKKTLSDLIIEEDTNEIKEIKEHFSIELRTFECNMRKFNVIGGIFHLELLKQPPQPKMMKEGAMLRMIIGVDDLQKWHYSETYEPPVKGGATKHSTDDDDEDAENTPEGNSCQYLSAINVKSI